MADNPQQQQRQPSFPKPTKVEAPVDGRSKSNPAVPAMRDLIGKEGWFRFDFPTAKEATTARAQSRRAGEVLGVKVRTKSVVDEKTNKEVPTAFLARVEAKSETAAETADTAAEAAEPASTAAKSSS